jgi:hypothetical protein
MVIQNKYHMRHKPYIKVYTKIRTILKSNHTTVAQASIIVPQIQSHCVIVDISSICSQSINIYVIVVVTTFAKVKI